MLRFITIALIASATLFGADEKPLLTLPTQNALAAFEKDVVAARKAYDIALMKAADAALGKLEKEKRDLTTKAFLEGALSVDKVMREISDGTTVAAIEDHIKKQNDILGTNNDLKKEIIGTWKASVVGKWSGTLIVDDKLNARINNGATCKAVISNNTITMAWSNGISTWKNIRFNISTKTFTGECYLANGQLEAELKLVK
jgi:hypothetical protein